MTEGKYNFETTSVKLVEWDQIEPEPLGGDLAEDLGKILNKFVRYALNDWWSHKGFQRETKNEYLLMRGPFDKTIRPSVYVAKAIACCVKFKIFDGKEVGCKLFAARDRYIKLIRSCLFHHSSNAVGGWGLNDEHLPVAVELLFASWLVWDKLNIRDQQYAINLLNSEIEWVMDTQIAYNYNTDGSETDELECQTIVSMNRANLLFLASLMLGCTEKSQSIYEKAILTYRSCFSSKTDGDMGGYNIDEDMFIRRFGTRSPFATSYIGAGRKAFVYSKIASVELPSGVARNFEQIYTAFYSSSYGENGKRDGVFTLYDKKNRPIGNVNYPDGVRGGKVNESALYAMDIFAFCLGYENSIEPNSREWAKIRMKSMEKLFKSNKSYAIQGCNQNKNLHGEAVCSELAECYIALFLSLISKKTENNFMDRFSREEYGQEEVEEEN